MSDPRPDGEPRRIRYRDLPDHERRALRSPAPHPWDAPEPDVEPDPNVTADDERAEADRAADRYERALWGDR